MDEEIIAFLSKFKELPADTLFIYSPNLQDTDDAFYGEPIDTTQTTIFPESFYSGPDNTAGFYACYKFPIDKNTVGLIVRTPAMYVSSSVKLYIYDKTTNKVTSYIELAEFWGDAGDLQEKEAFLIYSAQNDPEVLVWDMQSHDNNIENPSDKTKKIRNDYYQVRITTSLDTISKDTRTLEKRYKDIKAKY